MSPCPAGGAWPESLGYLFLNPALCLVCCQICHPICSLGLLEPLPSHHIQLGSLQRLAWPLSGDTVGVAASLTLRVSGSSAHSLKEQKNLNSFFAVMFGLSNSAISRLAHTWEVGVVWRAPLLRSGLRPSWECWMGLGLPQSSGSSASLSQRLPHKVRKLYSALERLLVSAQPCLAWLC